MFTTLVFSALVTLASPTAGAPTNTICPVLGNAVTPGKSAIVKVKGHEYYICCAGCDTTLVKDPDKYLDKDGTPKNAKSKAAPKAEHDPGMHQH